MIHILLYMGGDQQKLDLSRMLHDNFASLSRVLSHDPPAMKLLPPLVACALFIGSQPKHLNIGPLNMILSFNSNTLFNQEDTNYAHNLQENRHQGGTHGT